MPSLGIAPVPGGAPAIWSCGCRAGAGFMRLSGEGGVYPFWRLGFRQCSFSHITRVFPAPRPYASARPLVSWHAIVPFTFRILSKPSDPGISSKFLPAKPGIQQGASRRSHVLMHIDRGHPVIEHSHAPPPEAAVVTNREQKARRPTGPLTSIRRLTHALAAAAGMTRNGDPSTTLSYGLGNGPE